MKNTKTMIIGAFAGSLMTTQAAVVSWGAVGSGIQSSDLIETGSPYAAINGGADPGLAFTIGTNAFTGGGFVGAVAGSVINTTGSFYTPLTDNVNLDTIMDSHTYIAGANPNGVGVVAIPVTLGNAYDIQFIGVGDSRSCCNTRAQVVDDGNGNTSGGLIRGTGDWVVGNFVADNELQQFFVAGGIDPGLSGLIVRDLGPAIPEPGSALLSLVGLLGLTARRRR
ncbi:PEP-CTERM sorting domain-containing protein [bacterium]|nr:PEP-CTERM sorting domain-containing protein [bacterium]